MTQTSQGRTGLTFLLLACGAASVSLLQSLLSPVLPTLQHELGTSRSAVSWVLIAYLLSAAVATPILGKVGDTIGKKRTLVLCLSAIIVGSLVAALAPNIELVVLGRVIQGLSGAVFPLSYGIVRDEFAPEKVPSALGAISSVIAVGGGLGAVLAGPIVGLLGWRWLFWMPMIVVAIVALLAGRFVPESPVRSGGKINWLAASLLAGWLVALLLPLSQGTQWGWSSPIVIGLLVASVVLMAVWIWVEAHSSNPLIDMTMMRLPAVWTANLVSLLFGAAMFAVWAFLPQFIQVPASSGYGFGATVSQAGWVILPMLVTMAIGGMISGPLSKRVSFKAQLTGGSAIISATTFGFAFLHHSIWQLALLSGLFGVGLGFAYASMTNVIVRSVPAAQTGAASGMNANIRLIGGAIGTAVMTAIVTSGQQVGGIPSEAAFTTGFALFGVVAACAIGVCLLIPSGRKAVVGGVVRV